MDQVGNETLALKVDFGSVVQACLGNDISFLDFVASKNVS